MENLYQKLIKSIILNLPHKYLNSEHQLANCNPHIRYPFHRAHGLEFYISLKEIGSGEVFHMCPGFQGTQHVSYTQKRVHSPRKPGYT